MTRRFWSCRLSPHRVSYDSRAWTRSREDLGDRPTFKFSAADGQVDSVRASPVATTGPWLERTFRLDLSEVRAGVGQLRAHRASRGQIRAPGVTLSAVSQWPGGGWRSGWTLPLTESIQPGELVARVATRRDRHRGQAQPRSGALNRGRVTKAARADRERSGAPTGFRRRRRDRQQPERGDVNRAPGELSLPALTPSTSLSASTARQQSPDSPIPQAGWNVPDGVTHRPPDRPESSNASPVQSLRAGEPLDIPVLLALRGPDFRERLLKNEKPGALLTLLKADPTTWNDRAELEEFGRFLSKAKRYDESIELHRRIVQLESNADTLNGLAWELVSAGRGAEALEPAKEAAKLSGRKEAYILDTLAHATAGHLKKPCRRGTRRSARSRLLLAAAERQHLLGDVSRSPEEARRAIARHGALRCLPSSASCRTPVRDRRTGVPAARSPAPASRASESETPRCRSAVNRRNSGTEVVPTSSKDQSVLRRRAITISARSPDRSACSRPRHVAIAHRRSWFRRVRNAPPGHRREPSRPPSHRGRSPHGRDDDGVSVVDRSKQVQRVVNDRPSSPCDRCARAYRHSGLHEHDAPHRGARCPDRTPRLLRQVATRPPRLARCRPRALPRAAAEKPLRSCEDQRQREMVEGKDGPVAVERRLEQAVHDRVNALRRLNVP